LLATQVVKMILKIDDVMTPSEFWVLIMFHGWPLCWSNFCLFNDELHTWPACIVVWHLLNTLVFVSSHCIPWSPFKNRIEECYGEMSYFSVFWMLNALLCMPSTIHYLSNYASVNQMHFVSSWYRESPDFFGSAQ
jgi:hypothetical protein